MLVLLFLLQQAPGDLHVREVVPRVPQSDFHRVRVAAHPGTGLLTGFGNFLRRPSRFLEASRTP